ncbi:ankyrin repeat-containing domain protein [Lentinula raphanica]|nr:ankyrin repeat-containing domain protein [Lentinula raphanica]
MSYNLSIQHTESTGISTHDSILEDTTIFVDISSNEKDELHKWLATPDCSINHVTALSKRATGTSQWIFRVAAYLKWKKEGKFLWIQGKAGSGKTIVVASIIENLKISGNSGLVVYHYFDLRNNAGEKRSYQGLLLNLLVQLGIQSNRIHPALKSLYELFKNRHLVFKPTNNKLADIFMTVIRDLVQRKHQLYIIIDALDECNDSDSPWVLDLLFKVTRFPMVGIVISSRNHPHHNFKCVAISLDHNNRVNTDISHVIEDQSQKMFKIPALQLEVKQLLLQKVDEGFRYIECQLHVFKEYAESKHAIGVPTQLPSDLKETYTQAIAEYKKNINHSEEFHHLLLWLLYSFEPLHKDQVAAILCMKLVDSSTVPSSVALISDLGSIVNTTLIAVDAQDIVQFSHASVKEFLLEIRDNIQVKELFNVNAQLAHNIMAHMCLTYLLQYTHYEDTDSETKFVGESLRVFKHYATQYWAEHSKYNENSDTPFEDTLTLTQKFLEDSPKQFMNWKRNYNYMGDKIATGSQIFQDCHPVHVVAFFGLRNSTQRLLAKITSTQNNTSGEMLGTALQTAAFGGQKEIVQLLLRYHADVNIQGGYHGTALQAAISGRSKSVTHLLLEYNADVNAEGGYYGTAIQAAASGGDQDIVQLLLKHNANPNVQGGYYGTALQAAAFKGHSEIIEMLLKIGATVNTLGGIYGSALQAAVAENYQNIIQILLKHNANPNTRGGYYGTALQAAAFWGYKETIQLLLKYSADINMQGGEYGTALQAAVAGSHKDTIQILLDKGADISIQGGYYGTALHAAAFLGYKEILQLFLRYNVDVNTQGGEYGTALQAAAIKGHKNIIELLIKHGAKINAQGGQHGTALQIAENNDQQDLIEFLLEHGADVDAYVY